MQNIQEFSIEQGVFFTLTGGVLGFFVNIRERRP